MLSPSWLSGSSYFIVKPRGVIHSRIPCTLSRKHPGTAISLRGPCSCCGERRCKSHCKCARNWTAVGRAGPRPAPKAVAAPLPKAKAKPKAAPKAAVVPPPVVVAGPVGPMPRLSMERLRPLEWYRAMVAAVGNAGQVFSGSYQYDHVALTDMFLRRVSSRPAFELILLVDT